MADPWTVVGQTPVAAQPQNDDPWKVIGQQPMARAKPKAPLPTAQPLQSGDAPWMESMGNDIGDILGLGTGHGPPKPTGFLPLDTLREYPYQAEAGIRSGLAMARHGANALGEGKPSGAVGLGVGGIGAVTAPVSALFGPVSRPVHDWLGNPAEEMTGIPGTADVVTAGFFAAPGALKGITAPRGPRISEPVPPRTQIDRNVSGITGEEQRSRILERLQQAKKEAYRRSEEAGVIIKPDALKVASDEIRATLADEVFDPEDHPALGRFWKRFENAAAGGENITLEGLDGLRKKLVDITQDFNNPSQARIAGELIGHIDDMPLADSDVIVPHGVDQARAINDLRQGRSLAKTQYKAQMIDRALTRALTRADKSKTNDIETQIRNELDQILSKVEKGRLKIFGKPNGPQVAQLRAAVRGKGLNNLMRWAGGISPDFKGYSMISSMAGATAGSAFGPLGSIAGATIGPGIGAAAKIASEGMNRRAANTLFNTVVRGEPPQAGRGPTIPPAGNGMRGPQPPLIPAPGAISQPGAPRLPGQRQLPAPQANALSSTMYSNPFGERIASGIENALGFNKPPPQMQVRSVQTQAPLPRMPKPIEPPPPEPAITAYHGTPHDFDKFDSSKIGTGEGAQAYGHGLYFAENEKIAQSYRDALTSRGNRHQIYINEPGGRRAVTRWQIGDTAKPEQIASDAIGITAKGPGQVTPEMVASAKKLLDGWAHTAAMKGRPRSEPVSTSYKAAAAWLDTHSSKLEVAAAPTGKVFQVAIKARPEEFLDWDKPLREQPQEIRRALSNVNPEKTGAQAYAMAKGSPRGATFGSSPQGGATRDQMAATQALLKRGIKGIRYRDAGSRGADAKGSTNNYVIFDDKLISVLKKYGIPLTIGTGGAVIVSGANLPPDIKAQLES